MTEVETARISPVALELADDLLSLRAKVQAPGLVCVDLPPALFGEVAAWNEHQLRAAATVSWEEPGQDIHLFGFGQALALNGSGGDALATAAPAVREAAARVHVGAVASEARPRFFGGARFDPDSPHRDPVWDAFGAWRFVLPEIIVATRRGKLCASLTLALGADQTRAEVAIAVVAAVARVVAPPSPSQNGATHRYERTGPDAPQWCDAVSQALAEIGEGRYRKAVLALQVRCVSEITHNVAATLSQLADRYDACFVFGFRAGGSSWVGASPELLVSLEGGVVRASSLAGTCARGANDVEDRRLADELLGSTKEQSEHELVVRATRQALAPLCDELAVPETPQLMQMADIQHLHTPVEGVAAAAVDLFDVLLAMHPTPAVGGWPTAPALEAIGRLEGIDRGWYSGPIGWIDMNGEGAFAVALRAALLREGEALLYAGAGIVEGSDPWGELAETELKLHPLLEALRGG